MIALVVVGDQRPQLLGAGHGIGPARVTAVLRAHPTIPEPSTTDGSLGS